MPPNILRMLLVCCRLQVYLWRVCESVLRLTRPMVKDNVRLINCISRDMPPVKGDSTRLMQVRSAAASDVYACIGACHAYACMPMCIHPLFVVQF
jgi:hypothetical protein